MSLYLLYVSVAFFYVISPGPAIFLAVSNGMAAGLRAVLMSTLGNIVGLFLLSLVSILGLGAIVLASSSLFLLVKIVGAAYLLYLGVKQFFVARKLFQSSVQDTFAGSNNANTLDQQSSQRSLRSYFLEGFFLAATNPKPILFFVAIFPQFLVTEKALIPQFLLMTFSFMLLSFLSLLSYGYIAKSAKNFFNNTSRMALFHRITGGLFIGMGATLLGLKNTQA